MNIVYHIHNYKILTKRHRAEPDVFFTLISMFMQQHKKADGIDRPHISRKEWCLLYPDRSYRDLCLSYWQSQYWLLSIPRRLITKSSATLFHIPDFTATAKGISAKKIRKQACGSFANSFLCYFLSSGVSKFIRSSSITRGLRMER